MKFHVPDMTCGHCRASVQEALARLDPGARVSVDLSARMVEVATAASAPDVVAALAEIGFPATPA
ncbi:heavy-metal-associated domain-containing protein [Ruixingdingia sedimenti]|uniref:Heavy-metal-associated domain-containing protein n=1 Tax=Ruixingdingia sedimenti TaxID=3073604 RepID=A0ABU1F459_9RHOB|nr:heavy-metal-associated domain-containing protein [Xinfangfangia sp. LG-4]MDR5651651.1 heavy-metal-associated domain-containing protein [Xinfangfangia sp. LG-4]